MKRFFEGKVYSIASLLELLISVLLICVILIMGAQLGIQVFQAETYQNQADVLNELLGKALNLAVGVEFIKMLCKHTASNVIEVLMFALARHMVVGHLSPIQTLIGVISIALLFATRKYLFCSFDEVEKISYKGNQKVRMINALMKLDIPYRSDETVGEFMKREMTLKGEDIVVGGCLYYNGYVLRIAKLHENKDIKQVEIIRNTGH